MLDPARRKTVFGPLGATSTHWIAVGHTIRIVNVTHVPVLPFHDVRFHGAVAVVTKISFCCWWVHVSQHVNLSSVLQTNAVKPPLVLTLMSLLFIFSWFGSKSRGMSFYWTILYRMSLFYVCPKLSKSLGDEKKLSINILCPKPSTLQVKCLTVACAAVVLSVAECESVHKYTLMSYIYCDS
jgi:hypothetical protein